MVEQSFTGRTASPGVALGRLVSLGVQAATRQSTGDPEREAQALGAAIQGALAQLQALAASAEPVAAEVLGIQAALLEDDVLAAPAVEAIAGGAAAHDAWRIAMEAEASGYEASGDEYFRARAADLRDLRDRVLAHLSGGATEVSIPPGSVVAATDLAPSQFLAIDWSSGGALALREGSPTSHVSMLARARGIPAVVGLGAAFLPAAETALVDADAGLVVVDPGERWQARVGTAQASQRAARAASEAAAHLPAATADGTAVQVLLNVADPAELDTVDPAVCDGIGLVRTELLFHGGSLPGEEAQVRVYARLLEWAGPRPVTVRTLDAGGDKPIPGLTLDGESNPFLGVRGLRLSFERPAVFRTQLRALARAATQGDLRVMLPMVTRPEELARARALLAEAVASLHAEGIAARVPPLGIMVEVPAAAIAADLFDADFYSIGSNDLAQYVAAAGRDVHALAELADPVQPAMLRVIRHVVDTALHQRVSVSLCGDAGGDPAAIPHLLRAGLRALSMAPGMVGAAKLAIAATDLRDSGPADGPPA